MKTEVVKSLYSFETEQRVLGLMLFSQQKCDEALAKLMPEDFFDLRHRRVFNTIATLREEGMAVDTVTVCEKLGKELSKVGASFISGLLDSFGSVSDSMTHLNTLRDKRMKRTLRDTFIELIGEIEDNRTFREVSEEMQSRMITLVEGADDTFVKTMKMLEQETMTHLDKVFKAKGYTGIATGFNRIDEHMGGFQRQELVIIAGRPSMGKSQLAIQTAVNMARRGFKVGFFSIEMSGKGLYSRMLAVDTPMEYKKIRHARMTEQEMKEMWETSGRLCGLNIFMDDSSHHDVEHIINQIRLLKMKHNIDAVFVDHLQLTRTRDGVNNRNEELDRITQMLKAVAKDLDISVTVLSQLSRNCENRENKRPTLSDLRESGGIEQNADIVMGIYRDEYYKEYTDKKNIAEIIFLKGRDTGTGSVELAFFPELVKFANLDNGEYNR